MARGAKLPTGSPRSGAEQPAVVPQGRWQERGAAARCWEGGPTAAAWSQARRRLRLAPRATGAT